jgi:hypothetical protein
VVAVDGAAAAVAQARAARTALVVRVETSPALGTRRLGSVVKPETTVSLATS